MSTVYLIHFDRPIGDPNNARGQARHYLGCSEREVDERLEEHRRGKSDASKIMRAVKLLNIDWQLARTWEGDRSMERQLKRQHNSARFCPICRAAKERELQA